MCPNPSSIHNSPCFPGAGAPYLEVSPFPPSFHILTSFPFGPWDVPLKVTMSFLALSIPGFLREPLCDPPVLASSRWLCACWSAGLSRLVGPQQASGQSQAEHHQYQASVEPFWSGGEDSASSHWAGPGGCVDKGAHCLHVRGLLLATGRREGETVLARDYRAPVLLLHFPAWFSPCCPWTRQTDKGRGNRTEGPAAAKRKNHGGDARIDLIPHTFISALLPKSRKISECGSHQSQGENGKKSRPE